VADESKETDIKPKEQQGEGAASGSSAARKKEPPAFAWKLTGYADGLTLTLLKCVERKDADAQLARLEKEGYYTGLLVTPLTDSVPPAPSVKKKWEPTPARVLDEDIRARAIKARPTPPRPVEKVEAVASKPLPKTATRPVAKKAATAKSKAPTGRKASAKATAAEKAPKAARAVAKAKPGPAKSAAKAPKAKKPKAPRKKK
jgi:hypothetical protein